MVALPHGVSYAAMKIAVVVYGSPTAGRSHQSALRFLRAAVEAGHAIVRVFFYHDAVLIGSALSVAPQDEADIGAEWESLARDSGIELCLCISAAIRRGILNESEAQRYERSAHVLRPAFEIAGLGQLAAAVIDADRVVVFPA
ncbi:MAG: sulfurtransferase complex subunit TusD [Gammaproteobacteria bacterium]|nr:sulfurtransferase complex subunit TusD [Gammaproteobacteria bacterium]